MKEIALTRGLVSLVDDDDFERLSEHRWHAGLCDKRFYARRRTPDGATVLMHRQILGFPIDAEVDHANGNPLDNRRSNLRVATRSQNMANCIRQVGVTGFRGVTKFKRTLAKPYMAQIKRNGKATGLGYFATAEEAAREYDKHAYAFWGEFARLNFPGEIARLTNGAKR